MKVLLTGSNGLLGQKIIDLYSNCKGIELIATSRGSNRHPKKSGYTYRSLDITNREDVQALFCSEAPDTVLHAAAMTHVDQCEQHQEACTLLNVAATEFLLEAATAHKAHFVFVSTDFIFDGTEGPYKEDGATPRPLSFYGESKLLGEQLVMQYPHDWAIVRTVLVYGVSHEMSRSNIVIWAKTALEKGDPIHVVDDQWRTPTLAEDLAIGCMLVGQQRAKGIYNISGKDFMSVLELVERVADYFNLDKTLIRPISSTTLNQPAKRPPRTGFVVEKANKSLGYAPRSFEEGIGIVSKQMGFE
ncbi:MAG: NAD(P)-dependent oxidoreductase [Schleiferiaceae bacterium]|nr:NAD(P)-dependent oxidoreductase [Schleiferiaceae bacterium]